MLQGNYLESKGKIRLGRFPYTYARVSVMRSFLLKKDDYHRLMKMDINEMTSYLQSSQYKKEIDELGLKFKGTQLMDLALSKNLANTWAKLKKISPPNLRALIAAYLLRADIWNIKTIVRAKYTGLGIDALQAMLLPSGFLTEKKLADLSKKDSAEEVLKTIEFIDYGNLSSAVERFKETKSVAEIENALDKFYYLSMEELSKRMPNDGKLFKEFIEKELEASTIITILRLKRAGTNPKEIEGLISIVPQKMMPLARKMINAASAADAAKLLEQSQFKAISEKGIAEFLSKESLISLELDLSKYLLKQSGVLIHKHPLSVDVILGYLFAKEIEVRNLKLMLKAKKLGMSTEFAEAQIITV